VFHLSSGNHLQTITEAAITLDLASRAYLGTLLHHPVILLVLSRSDHWQEGGKCQHGDYGLRPEHSKLPSFKATNGVEQLDALAVDNRKFCSERIGKIFKSKFSLS